MPRYAKQDDMGGKKVLPSVTEVIGDSTSDKHWAIPYGVNQACDWIEGECLFDTKNADGKKFDHYLVTPDDLRKQTEQERKEKEYPDNARYAHKHHSQKALDIGSEVHNAVELYLKDKLHHVNTTDEILEMLSCDQSINSFLAFLKWENEHNLKPIALEQTVYGDGWAGTLDFYGYFDDKLYVIDWKSSKAHYPEMRYQVAAYRWAKTVGQDIIPEAIQGSGILRLDKETGLPSWRDHSKTYKNDLSIFNAMVDLYFKRHPIIRKKARGK